jgi:hypothetical protein
LLLPDSGVLLRFRGATPLGTSAGTGEALHLVDSLMESAEHTEVITSHPSLFREVEPGVYAFRKDVREAGIREAGDEALAALYARAQRYQGKGCLTAVNNVHETIARAFVGRDAARMTLGEIDSVLLGLERSVAVRRNKLAADAPVEDCIAVMQRKQNLGMNAVLSVSLALARGVAHVCGKELYELLREEMLAMIDRLAAECEIEIAGSTFSDYTLALRQASQVVERRGMRLHETLREISGIYSAGAALPE